MYKVSEVARICGVSTAAVYKILKRVDNAYTIVGNGKTLVTEEGLAYFIDRFQRNSSVATTDSVSSDVVLSLLHQLEEKDKQLQSRDGQIDQLMEQSRNYQILIKAEQEKNQQMQEMLAASQNQLLQLNAPRSSLWARLFGKEKDPSGKN